MQYHDPAKDPQYKSSITFPPAGKGKGKCFCFPCPDNFTSSGGALNSPAAACLPKLHSCGLQVRYQLADAGSSSSGCSAAVSAAAGNKLMLAMKKAVQAADKSMVLFTDVAAGQVGAITVTRKAAFIMSHDSCVLAVTV
jgi:hypothetical protein